MTYEIVIAILVNIIVFVGLYFLMDFWVNTFKRWFGVGSDE